MRKASIACLACSAFAYSVIYPPSSGAEIIGDIMTSGSDSFAAQFEGQMGTLWRNGSLPVTLHVIDKGETDIGKIWVDRYQLGYFPAWMNALTCDLNPDACYRPLHLPPGPIEKSRLTSTFQLGTDPGVWHGLVPGYVLVLPDITVVRDTTSVTRPWENGRSLKELKARNYACQKRLIPGLTCDAMFEYYNPRIGRTRERPETFEEPVYTYTFHIDSECEDYCAVLKPADRLKLESNGTKGVWWAEPPYELVTTTPATGNDKEIPGKVVQRVGKLENAPTFDQRQAPDAIVEQAQDKALDQKIDQAKDAYEKGSWDTIQKVSPFSDWISSRQKNEWQLGKFPDDEEKFTNLLSRVTGIQNVMIIDSAFDEKHCEFAASKIVVWDCKNPENDFSRESVCKVRSNDQLVAANESEPGASPQVRSLCGDAGVVEEVPNPGTRAFRDKSHGTHLAGIIAARWDDRFGTGGINPTARIIAVEIDFDKAKNDRYGQWLAAKLSKLMVDINVRVVNLSLGFSASGSSTTSSGNIRSSDWLTQLIKGKKGSVFVVAAGNERDPDDECLVMPACKVDVFSNVVSVVALDLSGKKVLENANYNKKFTLGSSGEQIFAPIPGNKFSTFSGSSQAAAIVSGAVSLAISLGENYAMRPPEIRDRLIACSDIPDRDLLGKMMGGGLDFDCFATAQDDIVYLDADTATSPFELGEAKPSSLHFKDINDGHATEVDFPRLLGFQRLSDSSDDVIIFMARKGEDSGKQPERLRGSFQEGDVLTLQDGDDLKRFPVKNIVKYVRKSVEGD
ncbi:S8 family peptidase [Rhizobium sp. LjRoot254]|uniref:S8 family peptidase n=1 Tax=Rhizobium sp. LjRoot254 TaxID=3342297 RepID=UPI003ECE5ECE